MAISQTGYIITPASTVEVRIWGVVRVSRLRGGSEGAAMGGTNGGKKGHV